MVFFGGLADDGERSRHLDFVVLGPHLVTTLEHKRCKAGEALHRGSPRLKDAVSQASVQAQILGPLLSRRLDCRVFVEFLVLVTGAEVPHDLDSRVLHLENVAARLLELDEKQKGRESSRAVAQSWARIREFLEGLKDSVPEDGPVDLLLLNEAEREHHRSLFVPRQELLGQIRERLRRGPGEYLMLTGPPGAGKSGLAAALAAEPPDGWTVVVHLVRSEPHPDRFLPALTSELYRLVNLGPARERPRDLRAALSFAASVVNRPLVVVVDGLDELESSEVEFLPANLPDNVRVLVTGRSGAPQVRRLRARVSRLREVEVPPLSSDEESLLLERRLGAAGLVRLSGSRWWTEAVRAAEGSPLVLHKLADYVARTPEPTAAGLGRRRQEVFEEIVEALAPTGTVRRRVLDMLAVAREPLTPEQLFGALSSRTELEFPELARELQDLRPLLLGDERNGTWRPWHRALVEFLTSRLGTPGMRSLNKRFAEWCARSQHEDSYALRHLVRHLLAGGAPAEAGEALMDVTFLDRRCRAGDARELLREVTEVLGHAASGAEQPRGDVERYGQELREWAAARREHPEVPRALPLPPRSSPPGSGTESRDRAEVRRWRKLEAFLAAHAPLLESRPDLFLSLAASEGNLPLSKDAEELLRGSGRVWLRETAPLRRPPTRTVGLHGADVRGLAATPDFRIAATYCADGSLRLWDVAAGELLAEANLASVGVEPSDPLEGARLRLSADARNLLLVEPDLGVFHWRWTPGGELGLPEQLSSGSAAEAFLSLDGLHAVTADGEGLLLHDLASPGEPRPLDHLPSWLSLRPLQSGLRVLSGPGEVLFQDVATSTIRERLEAPERVFLTASADLRLVALMDPDELRIEILDRQSGKALGTALGDIMIPAPGLELSPDGSELLFAEGRRLLVRRLAPLDRSPRQPASGRLTSDASLGWLVLLEPQQVRVLPLREGVAVPPPRPVESRIDAAFGFGNQVLLPRHEPWLVFSEHGFPRPEQLKEDLSETLGHFSLRAVNLATGEEIVAPGGPWPGISGALCCNQATGEVVCCARDTAFAWKVAENQTREGVPELRAISEDGRLGISFVGEEGASLMVWDLDTALPRGTFSGHSAGTTLFGFTPSGTVLTRDELGVLLEWEPASGEIRTRVDFGDRLLTHIRLIPGTGQAVVAFHEEEVLEVVDLATGEVRTRYPIPGGVWYLSEVTHDGHLAILANWREIRFFHVEGLDENA